MANTPERHLSLEEEPDNRLEPGQPARQPIPLQTLDTPPLPKFMQPHQRQQRSLDDGRRTKRRKNEHRTELWQALGFYDPFDDDLF